MADLRLGKRYYALRWPAGVTAAAALATILLPRLSQPPWYHHFADARAFLGVPNAGDVLSNVGFLLVGVPGMLLVLKRSGRLKFIYPKERWPYLVFFAAIALASAGSAYYHLSPNNDRLFWDRLPISIAAGAILAGVIGDRLGGKAGNLALVALVVLGVLSTVHWIHSEHAGQGDLRFYAFMQAYPALIVPVLALTTATRYTRTADLLAAGGFYAAAKTAEFLDKPIFSLGGIVSGHTLKHLLAAGSALVVLRMLAKRQVVETAGISPTIAGPQSKATIAAPRPYEGL